MTVGAVTEHLTLAASRLAEVTPQLDDDDLDRARLLAETINDAVEQANWLSALLTPQDPHE